MAIAYKDLDTTQGFISMPDVTDAEKTIYFQELTADGLLDERATAADMWQYVADTTDDDATKEFALARVTEYSGPADAPPAEPLEPPVQAAKPQEPTQPKSTRKK